MRAWKRFDRSAESHSASANRWASAPRRPIVLAGKSSRLVREMRGEGIVVHAGGLVSSAQEKRPQPRGDEPGPWGLVRLRQRIKDAEMECRRLPLVPGRARENVVHL
jgi:hypothetical protein